MGKREINMTVGSPTRHLVTFMLPLLFGNLFQILYNMVDSVIVGQFVGKNALAAVGSCSTLFFLFFGFSNGLAMGVGIITSQFYGADQKERIRKTIGNSYYVLPAAAFVIMAVSMLLSPAALSLMGTPDLIIGDARLYIEIACLGMIGMTVYNGLAAILRAFGDSRTPLYFLIFSSVLNVLLDLFLVVVCQLGVAGVSIATVISQWVSAICCFFYAWKRIEYFRVDREALIPDKTIITNAFKLGIPLALQNGMIAFSTLVLQKMVNGFGEDAIASFTITNRVEQLVHQPFLSLSVALTTFSGQNKGAGKLDRVSLGTRKSVYLIAGLSAVLLVVMQFGGRAISSMFVNEQAVIGMAARGLQISCYFYFILGMIYVPRAVSNGCGDAMFAMINGVTEVICRVGFSQLFLLFPSLGVWSIWYTTVATWSFTALICLFRYFQGKWKTTDLTRA